MRFILAVALLCSCIRPLVSTPREDCAVNGMVLEGMGYSEGHASGMAGGGGVLVGAHADSSGSSMNCRRPRTPKEECEVRAMTSFTDAKSKFVPGSRNFIQFLGYVAFIIPGVILHSGYIEERNQHWHAAKAQSDAVYEQCVERVQPPTSAPGLMSPD